MNIYLDNGYVDIEQILRLECPFTFVIGGRGTGKTFGALQYVLNNNKEFIFMRRTQAQLEIIKRPEYSPFNAVNVELGFNIETVPNGRYTADICNGEKTIGHILALSTISNLRGFSTMAEYLIYDEFIPEEHEKPIKGEGSAFLNAYETINRNRELKGRPPLQCLILSNSNTLKNPLLAEFGLVDILEKRKRQGKKNYINRDRGIAVFMLDDSLISEAKKETALYKAIKNSAFYKMAIKNEFANDVPENIRSENIKEYKLLFYVDDELAIYKHKSQNKYYVTAYINDKNKEQFSNTKIGKKRIRRKYGYLLDKRLREHIFFENYSIQIRFDELFNM